MCPRRRQPEGGTLPDVFRRSPTCAKPSKEQFNETHAHPLLRLLARLVKKPLPYGADGRFNQSADSRRWGMSPKAMRSQRAPCQGHLRAGAVFLRSRARWLVLCCCAGVATCGQKGPLAPPSEEARAGDSPSVAVAGSLGQEQALA